MDIYEFHDAFIAVVSVCAWCECACVLRMWLECGGERMSLRTCSCLLHHVALWD